MMNDNETAAAGTFVGTREMAPYLVFQRTRYQHVIGRALNRLGMHGLYNRYLAGVVEPPRIRTLMGMYYRHVAADLDGLRGALPDPPADRPVRILDIGAGLGGIDVLLDRHYDGRTDLHLLDKDGRSDIFYGYEPQAAFYNRIDLTRAFMEGNGVPASRFQCHNIDTDGFPPGEFDLVISLLSWCFHYPAATYSDPVAKALAPNGVLIVDVRHTTDGVPVLTDALGAPAQHLLTHGTYDRLAFVRPA